MLLLDAVRIWLLLPRLVLFVPVLFKFLFERHQSSIEKVPKSECQQHNRQLKQPSPTWPIVDVKMAITNLQLVFVSYIDSPFIFNFNATEMDLISRKRSLIIIWGKPDGGLLKTAGDLRD